MVVKSSFSKLLSEVIILDLIFSIDSIIIIFIESEPISEFIHLHPSFKILALCFLMMIGLSLLAEGFHFEIPKGYIYFSMGFVFLVDVIEMKTLER